MRTTRFRFRSRFLPSSLQDWGLFVITLVLMPTIYVYEMCIVLPYITNGCALLYFGIIFLGVFVIANIVGNLVGLVVTDTSVPREVMSVERADDKWEFCSDCISYVPPRAWHFSMISYISVPIKMERAENSGSIVQESVGRSCGAVRFGTPLYSTRGGTTPPLTGISVAPEWLRKLPRKSISSDMWLAVLLVLCAVALLLFLDGRKPRGFPPGPAWLPVLGSARELARLRKEKTYLFEACAELARRYGPVVGLRVGKDRQIVVSGFEALKEMFSREEFDGKPKGILYETRTFDLRRGLLLTDSDFWMEQRRFVIRQLKEFGFGRRTMAGIVQDEAAALAGAVKAQLDKQGTQAAIVPMDDAFGLYVLNTLWSMMASIRYTPEDAELVTLQSLLNDLFTRLDMSGAAFSQFPILQYLAPDRSGYTEFVAVHQRLWRFLRNELEKHKATYNPNEMRDFMDVYIKVIKSEANERTSSFSELQLLAICMDLFMAGSETTSKSLGFGFLYLIRHPEVQRKAQEEIDAVVGTERLPDLADRPNMPYLEAVALESIRMFMGRTFGVPHRALKDTYLMGHFIPKDAMMVANIPSVLMDKVLWGDPDNFRPERFLDANGKVSIPEYYLPFGYGKHRCLGETLARSNVFLFTATLLQRFHFLVPPGEPLPSTECVDGVTARTLPYSSLVTLRA